MLALRCFQWVKAMALFGLVIHSTGIGMVKAKPFGCLRQP